jgi:hypothetical protein
MRDYPAFGGEFAGDIDFLIRDGAILALVITGRRRRQWEVQA